MNRQKLQNIVRNNIRKAINEATKSQQDREWAKYDLTNMARSLTNDELDQDVCADWDCGWDGDNTWCEYPITKHHNLGWAIGSQFSSPGIEDGEFVENRPIDINYHPTSHYSTSKLKHFADAGKKKLKQDQMNYAWDSGIDPTYDPYPYDDFHPAIRDWDAADKERNKVNESRLRRIVKNVIKDVIKENRKHR